MAKSVTLKNNANEAIYPYTDKSLVIGLESALGGKQDTLVSGTNIKTINGISLLGSGNIILSGGGGSATVRQDTTAGWNAAVGFIPEAGEIIVYSDYSTKVVDGQTVNIPGIKIGSGNGYVQDLAFVSEDVADSIYAHIQDAVSHITAEERLKWNRKLNVNDSSEVVGETLIFNRN